MFWLTECLPTHTKADCSRQGWVAVSEHDMPASPIPYMLSNSIWNDCFPAPSTRTFEVQRLWANMKDVQTNVWIVLRLRYLKHPPQKKKTDLFCCVPAGLAPRARSPDVKWICGVAERGRRWGRWHPVTKSPSTDVRDTGSHQTLGGAQVSTPLYLGRDAWWEDSSPLVFHSMCCWHGRQTTKTTKEVRTNVENYKLKKCSSRGFGEPSHAFYWKLIYIYIFHGTWRCLLWSRDTSVLHCYC